MTVEDLLRLLVTLTEVISEYRNANQNLHMEIDRLRQQLGKETVDRMTGKGAEHDGQGNAGNGNA